MANVAFFGGSFNPPHVGHVLAVTYVLATQAIDEVLVVPCFRHPFSKELAPFAHRLRMAELAMGWLPRTRVSRVEEELGGDSLTLRTIEHLYATSGDPDLRLRLVVGADVLPERTRWHGFDRLAELAPPIVLGRIGVAGAGAPPPVLPEISSTDVRAALAAGRRADVEALVPRAVLDYVAEERLYGHG